MERHFELELAKLNTRIIEMSTLIDQQVRSTMKALVEGDTELAEKIVEIDNQVDSLDVKIDKLCQRIFALQQPVATDLRFIMSCLKINNDMERMGDLAVFIARRVEAVENFKDIILELGIDEVANETIRVVSNATDLLASRQTVLVKDIIEDSRALKLKSRDVASKIIDEMLHKSEVVVVASNLILILNQIERMSSYCSNIAEAVFFMVEGKIVKHSRDFLNEL